MKKIINCLSLVGLVTAVLVVVGCESDDSYNDSSSNYSDRPYDNTTRMIQVHVFNGSYGYVDQFGLWTGMVLVEIENAPYANLRPGDSTYITKEMYSHNDPLVLNFTEQATGIRWPPIMFGDRYQNYSVTLHGDGRPPTIEPPP